MQIPEIDQSNSSNLASFKADARPVVLRGLVRSWPIVSQSGTAVDAARSLIASSSAHRVSCVVGAPETGGRLFYRPDMSGFNFGRRDATVAEVLQQLLAQADEPRPLYVAMQSAVVDQVLPGFSEANRMPLLPPTVRPRIWIGNRIRVATHYDSSENIACVVAGRRRFTLFPPDQVANLYPGPLEMTPAGTPVSMVDPDAPDLTRYPRFAEAQAHAWTAELAPGDAIFIPYLWWHAVTSLDPVSVLVNYWWNDGVETGGELPAMLHALLAFQGISPERRRAWAALFGHFALHQNGDPAVHIPVRARGILGEIDAATRTDLYRHLAQTLARDAAGAH